jgi:uncharacterized RDD family membrane protein YckC
VSDWINTIRQSVGGNTHAEINAPDAGMLLTDTELVYLSIGGMQRAKLGEIAKVTRENGELVISSSDRPLIRGAIKADKETLSNFFSQVRQVAAWSRERRTVIMESPSATPMDSSFVGRTPDAPVSRPEMPDPIAQMPIAPPVRSLVTVSQSESLNPLFNPPPLLEPMTETTQSLGRAVAMPVPVRQEDKLMAGDRPRVTASLAPRFSESRVETVKLEYAGFWIRFVAYFIDLIVLSIVGGVISFVFSGGGNAAAASLGISSLANLIFVWLYYAFLESGERQGTLGKMALGLIVSNESGEALSFGQSTWRFVVRAVPGIIITYGATLLIGVAALGSFLSSGNADGLSTLVGGALLALVLLLATYVMAAFTPKKQALHDLIAKTLVLKK